MSLTSPFGNAPFESGGGQFDHSFPQHIKYWEPWPRRMRAVLSGETILDSRNGLLIWDTGRFPDHYYPLDDLRPDLLVPSSEERDGRRRWSVRVAQRYAEDCVTASPHRPEGEELLPGYVTIDFGAMDRWFEEDDLVYGHPRDPYHRVDIRSSSRHVVVRHAGQVIAESDRPKLLFETGNPVRYYLPFADVRTDLLVMSSTMSECPYKGDGQHWHLVAEGERVEDAAWSLPHPLPEGLAAAQHICFYPHKVDVEVAGERIAE